MARGRRRGKQNHDNPPARRSHGKSRSPREAMIMGRWHRIVTLIALASLLTPAAWGQSAQHDEVEVIKAPERVPEPKADLAEVTKRILDGTNAFRKEQSRPSVTVNKQLMETAAYFARYMAENDRFGHTADGKRPADRVTKHGYE